MGMVMRVLYNNQGWHGRCEHPSEDSLCSPCFDPKVNIQEPKSGEEKCSGLCWEQELCTSYEWGAGKHGKKFSKRAQPGLKVFFVWKQPDGKYTIWGRTTVDSVNVPPKGNKAWSVKEGYTEYIRFHPFTPLPRDKWVVDLRDINLVDKPWKQGRYRFISGVKENELEKRIEGLVPETTATTHDEVRLGTSITGTMHGRLEKEAREEGRQIDEIVREAIAEWLKERRG